FFSSALSHDEALDALGRAASEAIRALEAEHAGAEESSTGHWSLAPVPGGVAVRIDEEPDDFEGLVRRIADGLEARGVEGSFDLYRPEAVVELPDAVDLFECRLRAGGARYHKRYDKYGWRADPEALWAGVESGVGWCLRNGADLPLQLVLGLITSSTLRPEDDVYS